MEKKPVNFNLREIPYDLHRQLKILSAETGVSMREIILIGIELVMKDRKLLEKARN